MNSIFTLATAGYMEWRDPHISFNTLEELKRHLIDDCGFSEEIMTDEDLFSEELDDSEMKYEKVPLSNKNNL